VLVAESESIEEEKRHGHREKVSQFHGPKSWTKDSAGRKEGAKKSAQSVESDDT
jgi:hypothetical protein